MLMIEERVSPNHDARPMGAQVDLLLMHYTGMADAAVALDRLCSAAAKVSAHYLVDEEGRIFHLVAEARRAWHAGVACWAGETNINGCSIGIEIANPGHELGYPDFPDAQMRAVEALALDILGRHPIPPDRVLAHSDVAPDRKADPGEKFDWGRLAAAGIGHWVEAAPIAEGPVFQLGARGDRVADLQYQLADYGYSLEVTGVYDAATEKVIIAFQRHFRPERVDGVADLSTVATLHALRKALAARLG